MTPEEAIKTLQALHDGEPTESVAVRRASILLGIEALKRYQLQCRLPDHVIWETLPGETKE